MRSAPGIRKIDLAPLHAPRQFICPDRPWQSVRNPIVDRQLAIFNQRNKTTLPMALDNDRSMASETQKQR